MPNESSNETGSKFKWKAAKSVLAKVVELFLLDFDNSPKQVVPRKSYASFSLIVNYENSYENGCKSVMRGSTGCVISI